MGYGRTVTQNLREMKAKENEEKEEADSSNEEED